MCHLPDIAKNAVRTNHCAQVATKPADHTQNNTKKLI